MLKAPADSVSDEHSLPASHKQLSFCYVLTRQKGGAGSLEPLS